MNYTPDEVMQYVSEEDVKFVRMAFCDVFGKQRNVAIMAGELPRAFAHGIAFDASAVPGFDMDVRSDLFLRPDPATLKELPWRPQHGRVAHMFCDIVHPDGTPFAADARRLLRQAAEDAAAQGYSFRFGTEMEFYLFRLDADGRPTKEPFDSAGYMDVAPEDRGENVRREICLTLERMGILPESSHHESGPGQNEIDFRFADPLSAADNAVTFRSVVRTVAYQNGLWADFSPRPLPDWDGNGMHINLSARRDGQELSPLLLVPGLLAHIRELTRFLNPTAQSYARLGRDKAPRHVSWSEQNRSQLLRVPAAAGSYRRLELRSPDALANPYLAFALLICACLDGIARGLPLPDPADFNLLRASSAALTQFETLPASLAEASALAGNSAFVRAHVPELLLRSYLN
ncbi:MAG: glutamine synthetase family protein [Oscillospiraceae bacterium]|nr:glutamine synthetase family protein [Oscillospiraceae bacterium]